MPLVIDFEAQDVRGMLEIPEGCSISIGRSFVQERDLPATYLSLDDRSAIIDTRGFR